MVELPSGIIIEERRGGAGVLATLLNEMVKLGTNGYIRSERTPSEKMPRVGQVLVSNGEICYISMKRKRFSKMLTLISGERLSRT